MNFSFVGDGIFYNCGKVGCHVKILLSMLGFRGMRLILAVKNMGVFLSDCWNIFGSLDYFGILMQVFYAILLEESW